MKLISLRLGTMRQVVSDSLDFYFDIVARDTACEGAELEHELVPARCAAPAAACEWDPAPPPLASHEPVGERAGAARLPVPRLRRPGEVEAGGELEVESIEVEDARRRPAS